MTFWFITESRQRSGGADDALYFDADGLPDLTRAMSRDHVREWVKHLRKGVAPEKIDDEATHYWRLLQEMHRDDHVVALSGPDHLMLGEITSEYRYESDATGGRHVWPVHWIATHIPLESFPSLKAASGIARIKEIPDSEGRIQFRKYFSSLQGHIHFVFRWVSIMILVAELVYFWPGK